MNILLSSEEVPSETTVLTEQPVVEEVEVQVLDLDSDDDKENKDNSREEEFEIEAILEGVGPSQEAHNTW